MQDIEELCSRVVVIDKGKVVYDGALGALKAKFPQGRRVTFAFTDPGDYQDVRQLGHVLADEAQSLTIGVADEDVARVCSHVLQAHKVSDMQIQESAIEDVLASLFTTPVAKP